MQINIIRQGLSLSFFILGFSLVYKQKFLIGFLLFLLSILIHISSILYFLSYLITIVLNIKKDTKLILLLIISFVSLTGIPFEMINSIEIPYITVRLIRDFSNSDSLPFLLKVSFYIFFFILVDYMMIEKSSSNKQISLLSFIIVSLAIFVFQNDLYSVRFLLALDFLFPILLLAKATHHKNKDYLLVSLFVVFLVFIISISSQAFSINFSYII
jgi:hypothetical protein